MIYGFFGSIPGCPHQRGSHALRGNGKTLCLTFVGYLDYLSGRDVISNYKTSFSEFVSTERIAEMVIHEDIRDTTILLSELQLYMNSLGVNTKELRSFVGSVIGQSRKRNTDIHYDTQRYTDVHPRIRSRLIEHSYQESFMLMTSPVSWIDARRNILYIYINMTPIWSILL